MASCTLHLFRARVLPFFFYFLLQWPFHTITRSCRLGVHCVHVDSPTPGFARTSFPCHISVTCPIPTPSRLCSSPSVPSSFCCCRFIPSELPALDRRVRSTHMRRGRCCALHGVTASPALLHRHGSLFLPWPPCASGARGHPILFSCHCNSTFSLFRETSVLWITFRYHDQLKVSVTLLLKRNGDVATGHFLFALLTLGAGRLYTETKKASVRITVAVQ